MSIFKLNLKASALLMLEVLIYTFNFRSGNFNLTVFKFISIYKKDLVCISYHIIFINVNSEVGNR